MGEDAVEQALRALRHRERSAAQVERHLEERGIDEHARAETLETLARTGLVDDRRFAESRARVLADRGAGDALIRHDLGAAGVDREAVDDALDALEDEPTRARRVVERRGSDARTVRYLLGKGFSADIAQAAVAAGGSER
jgi:SOS response regulatory protein OraA/RecX